MSAKSAKTILAFSICLQLIQAKSMCQRIPEHNYNEPSGVRTSARIYGEKRQQNSKTKLESKKTDKKESAAQCKKGSGKQTEKKQRN